MALSCSSGQDLRRTEAVELPAIGRVFESPRLTFQQIAQVAGRAGRAERPGRALLQTHQPEHPVIRAILSGDEEEFWRAEAAGRRAEGVPPYGRMAGIILSGPEPQPLFHLGEALARGAGPLHGRTLAPLRRPDKRQHAEGRL